jgi:hypothetical protein
MNRQQLSARLVTRRRRYFGELGIALGDGI